MKPFAQELLTLRSRSGTWRSRATWQTSPGTLGRSPPSPSQRTVRRIKATRMLWSDLNLLFARLLPCHGGWWQLREALGFEKTEELQDPPDGRGLWGDVNWAIEQLVFKLFLTKILMRSCLSGEGSLLRQQRHLPGRRWIWCPRLSLQTVERAQGDFYDGSNCFTNKNPTW